MRRTVWQGVATAPKTAKANRSIRLTGMVQEALKALKALKGQRGRDGKSGWVFPTSNGTLVNCHNLINRSWWPLLDKVGLLSRIPFHNLRHTCATLLLSQGVHPKLVRKLLGHADISTTLNTYSHVMPSLEGKTASAMEDALA